MARGSADGTGRSLSPGRVLAIAAGITATIVAWGLLVFAAIDFGRQARTGDGRDWAFLGVATVGAVACMFLAIVLAARLQVELRAATPRAPAPRPLPAPRPAASAAPAETRMTPGRHRS